MDRRAANIFGVVSVLAKTKDHQGKTKPVTFRSFFASVRLTLALLVLIALAAALGTFLPPSVDVYHSFWFASLLSLLSLNLVACSWGRFPHSWKRFRERSEPDRPRPFFDLLPPGQILMSRSDRASVVAVVEGVLRQRFRHVQKKETPEGDFFSAERGAFSRFGVYGVHLGVLVIIAGAIIGSFLGFTGDVRIAEGETAETLILRGAEQEKPLGFAVRLDRFFLDFYDNGTPRTYRSDLTFLKDGRVLYQGPLLVNHPISVGGLRFYQTSYGAEGKGAAALVIRKGKQDILKTVHYGDRFKLPGGEADVTIFRVEENLMNMGPAVQVAVRSAKGDVSFWVFQHIREIDAANPGLLDRVPLLDPGLFKPYVFSLTGLERRYFSDLQVTNDPGASVVAGGAFLMMAGFMFVFFASHRRIWVRIDETKEGTRVAVTGSANKDTPGLEREVRRFLERCRERTLEEV